MFKWWRGATLIVSLIVAATSMAQPTHYTPHGAARMPEPIPCAPTNLVPGPLPPHLAPQGPPNCLDLPVNHSNAFPCEEYPPEHAWFFHVGAQGLIQKRSGHLPLALRDTSADALDTGTLPVEGPLRFDASQLSERLNFGVAATVGVLFGSHSIELSGYYVSTLNRTETVVDPGRLNSFFVNPPVGFAGNNGLWTQADLMQIRRDMRFANAEVNYRKSAPGVNGFELLFGVRYIDFQETLEILTDDDGQTFPLANGSPDPTLRASYTTNAMNRIVAPQLGCEWTFINFLAFSAGFNAKGAWGVNFVEVSTSLDRGDGFNGFQGGRYDIQFTHLYDLGAHLNIHILERLRCRMGYNIFWLLNYSSAQGAIDFNLRNVNGAVRESGSTFFHGPSVELQFLF